MPKKLFVKTYGCQMNVYDSQRMGDVLSSMDYAMTDQPDDADLVILNTCHIREKAAEKVYSEIGRLRPMAESRKQDGANMMIAVAGCVAQAEGEEMLNRAPAIDLVFGPQSYHRLPELISRVEAGEKNVIETEFPVEDKFDDLAQKSKNRPLPRGTSAFVTVQEGCDKFCSFCVVPFTRGAEFSRPVAQIITEVEQLAALGVREITLLGQNVNAYEDNGTGLAGLLEQLGRIDGIERLRFTTSHPRDMDDQLIAAWADNPKLMPYLHLPVQAGSDRILKAMNRQHTADEYVSLIKKIRHHNRDLALSGDFIVGFPGETEADFEQTLQLVRDVTYAQAYSFKYSMRPGTKAAEMDGQVPEAEKSERLQRLQELLNEQQLQFNESFVGRQFDLLLERPGRFEGQLIGRSPYLQAVHVDGNGHEIGEIVKVAVNNAGKNSLSASIIETA